MQGVSESLAGRVGVFDFEGLIFLELVESGKLQDLPEAIASFMLRGGFPELWQDMARPIDIYLDSYTATCLEREVKQVLAVGSLRDF